jgi:hypothetical protein
VDDNARAFARNMLRLKVHEANGQGYEDLFVKVMQYARPKFRPVKPCGSQGDRSNDGFDSKTGTYFQVYAPEDIRKTPRKALTKLKTDFKGLKAFWHSIYAVKIFCYVVNDKYQGVSPGIEKELASIKRRHKLVEAQLFLARDLEDLLFSLPDNVIIAVVGHVPAINAGEFLFLSGFAYFIGAWIDFEKAGRRLIEASSRRIVIGRQMLDILRQNNVLDASAYELLVSLSGARNKLVHGDSRDVPQKDDIDKMVAITEQVKKHAQLSTAELPPMIRKV